LLVQRKKSRSKPGPRILRSKEANQ